MHSTSIHPMNKVLGILKLMRPKHYIKNLLILIPLVFSKNLFTVSYLFKSFLGFCSFSLLSSAIYIFNDIHDIDADRQHEVKCHRPIASGLISVPLAYCVATMLF